METSQNSTNLMKKMISKRAPKADEIGGKLLGFCLRKR